jgi:hypothetical protein
MALYKKENPRSAFAGWRKADTGVLALYALSFL